MSRPPATSNDPRLSLRHPNPDHRASENVRHVWQYIERLAPADLVLISETLRERLGGLIEPVDHQLSVGRATFERFVRESRRDSFAAYQSWYSSKSDLEQAGLHSPWDLRRVFGGPESKWDQVKRTLSDVACEDVTVRRLLTRCSASLEQHMIAGVHAFMATDDPVVTETGFLTWCARQIDDPDPTFLGPLPRQSVHIRQVVGDWPRLLSAAGFDEEARQARARLHVTPLNDEELQALLRDFGGESAKRDAGELGRWLAGLPPAQFEGLRRPTPETFERRFDGLPRAFYLAGVFSIEEFALKLAGQHDLGELAARASLAAAQAERGENLSAVTFDSWRRETVAAAAARGHLLLIQSSGTVCHLVGGGSWPAARACAAGWVSSGGHPEPGVRRDALLEGPTQ